jgi:hypothetical protein
MKTKSSFPYARLAKIASKAPFFYPVACKIIQFHGILLAVKISLELRDFKGFMAEVRDNMTNTSFLNLKS